MRDQTLTSSETRFQLESDEYVILASGVDSLYLFLDCPGGIDWKALVEQAERYDYGQHFEFSGVVFVREKAWMRTYTVCLRHGQILFFINRRTAYIKCLALGFEMRGYEGVQAWLCRILDG